MKKTVRNLVILTGAAIGAYAIAKKVKSTKTNNEKQKNSCFCSWDKIEQNSGYSSRNKTKEKTL